MIPAEENKVVSPVPTEESKYLIENDVKKYLDLQDVIKQKQKEVKEYKDLLKLTETSIVDFMTSHDLPVLQFKGNETLKLDKKTSKKGLQKVLLDEKFNNALSTSDSHETTECLEKLRLELEDREVSEKISLKYSKM
jgi:hypothetical protein